MSQTQVMREGTDVTLVSFGKVVGYNLKAAEQLEKEGISCEVCVLNNPSCNRQLHCQPSLCEKPAYGSYRTQRRSLVVLLGQIVVYLRIY